MATTAERRKRARILFVDDQKSAREVALRMFDDKSFDVSLAASVAEADELLAAQRPSVIVTDLRMPDVDGLEGLKRWREIDPDLPIILVTAFGTVETAVEAMKHGAFDYVRKPFEPKELLLVVERALEHRALVEENRALRSQIKRQRQDADLVYRSSQMAQVVDLVDRVAPTDFAVLITGESGTGKDVIARLIHRRSARADKAFVSLNCSAIPEHLLESELFGFERGAFSGAETAREGFFTKANGATLFLDEIGDMSVNLQPKLLRVLQDGEFYAVGSRQIARTDVRLICASNQDIPALVAQGRFRQDLYYRINTVRIELPPLRERPEDIAPLVEHFRTHLPEASHAPSGVSAAAMRLLLEYRWPGNVRELGHAVERAALVCDSEHIEPEHLPPEIRRDAKSAASSTAAAHAPASEHEHAHDALDGLDDEGGASPANLRDAREAFERAYFARLLQQTGGNVQKSAELAGIHRTTLYEKLAKLGIEIDRGS
ncbi:MAG: sigma-54-dependent Fis family transcriptional regulator [Myxococcales bacterium]|nr:sigma-54-dependent Fis family transcriptional regulator [Myxococcales bacterium]